jgi:hypothetical protein
MKYIFFIVTFGLFTLSGNAQTTKKATYGSNTYDVAITEAGGGGQFQRITLQGNENLYALIVKMIKDKTISSYKPVSETKLAKTPSKINLEFVTWQGYSACETVTREYVSVNIDGKSQFLLHKDQFDKVAAIYQNGKHKTMFSKFLYDTNITRYVSVDVTW